jgi:hypothetical protein
MATIGGFVKVGDSIGVVVGLTGINGIPEDHFAIWYGEFSKMADEVPLAKTVPVDYCVHIASYDVYH